MILLVSMLNIFIHSRCDKEKRCSFDDLYLSGLGIYTSTMKPKNLVPLLSTIGRSRYGFDASNETEVIDTSRTRIDQKSDMYRQTEL